MASYFAEIPQITYQGPDGTDPFAFRHYNPAEIVMGRRMDEHLRFAVAWWHSFAWPGGDPFGGQTFERPWFGDTMDHARAKADAAFDLFAILGQPFYCWHDADIRPEGSSFAESAARLDEITDYIGQKAETTGTKLSLGDGEPFLSPPLYGRCRHQPRPRGLCLCCRHGEILP